MVIRVPPGATALALVLLAGPVAAQSSETEPSLTRVYREVEGESLHAYVFLPPGHRASDRTPAVLLFHGGGWSAGAPDWVFPAARLHGERDILTPLVGVTRYCAALTGLGRTCDVHAYPGVGHLLTRNLANQESDFDPDPEARADGIAQHHRFLRRLGFVPAGQRR